jgi:hypothetical protein
MPSVIFPESLTTTVVVSIRSTSAVRFMLISPLP